MVGEESYPNSEKKKLKLSKNIKIQWEAVFRFFNEVFGEGADKTTFGNKTNLMICLKAFTDVTEMFDIQIENASKAEREITNKY